MRFLVSERVASERPSLLQARLVGAATVAISLTTALAGRPAPGEEARTPKDFYVPTSAHIECDSAAGVEVRGLDDVKTIDDILALRERLAAKDLSRDDLLSWRFLDDVGVERVVRRQDPPPPARDEAMVSRLEQLPTWRSDVIDFDAERYARRSAREDRTWMRIVVPTSQVWVDVGWRDEPTRVVHAVVAKGEGRSRIDAARECRIEAETILMRTPRGPDGTWETVRTDAWGTLFRKTLFIEGPAPPLNSIAETYVLADVAAEEIRCVALIKDGRPVHFRLAGQRLPQESSPEGRVLPQVVLEFRQGQWSWLLNAHFVHRVEFDPELAPDLFSYRLKRGDEYRVKLGKVVRSQVVGEEGLDVPAAPPAEAWESVRAGAEER